MRISLFTYFNFGKSFSPSKLISAKYIFEKSEGDLNQVEY